MFAGRLGARDARLADLILGHVELFPKWIEGARAVTWQESSRVPSWTEPNRSRTWSAPTMTILVKRSTETRLYTMDLSSLPEISGGDTIASVSSITCTEAKGPSAATGDLTLTSKAVTAGTQGLQCKIAGGTVGCTYQLTFTGVSTAGYILTGIGYLYVDNR